MSDQPKPTANASRPVIDRAIDLLEMRREIGLKTYGTPLQVGNGRDFGRDANEEMADWFIYWTGYRIEHAKRVQELLVLVGKQAEEIKTLKAEQEKERAEKAEQERDTARKDLAEAIEALRYMVVYIGYSERAVAIVARFNAQKDNNSER